MRQGFGGGLHCCWQLASGSLPALESSHLLVACTHTYLQHERQHACEPSVRQAEHEEEEEEVEPQQRQAAHGRHDLGGQYLRRGLLKFEEEEEEKWNGRGYAYAPVRALVPAGREGNKEQ